ncbi:hypothetical protein K439DRAFT_1340684 [Ramaria rubella]|nr:hypothetical protein K439DRAFT_1340684 [Ramaria rubella]
MSNIKLKLPPELSACRITPTFHMALIQPYTAKNDELFPKRDMKSFYDFGQTDEQELFVNEILAHRWTNNKELRFFQVHWALGDVTWEPLAECKELEALNEYLEL